MIVQKINLVCQSIYSLETMKAKGGKSEIRKKMCKGFVGEVIKNYVPLAEDYGPARKTGERERSPRGVSRALSFSFHGRVCFVFKGRASFHSGDSRVRETRGESRN